MLHCQEGLHHVRMYTVIVAGIVLPMRIYAQLPCGLEKANTRVSCQATHLMLPQHQPLPQQSPLYRWSCLNCQLAKEEQGPERLPEIGGEVRQRGPSSQHSPGGVLEARQHRYCCCCSCSSRAPWAPTETQGKDKRASCVRTATSMKDVCGYVQSSATLSLRGPGLSAAGGSRPIMQPATTRARVCMCALMCTCMHMCTYSAQK